MLTNPEDEPLWLKMEGVQRQCMASLTKLCLIIIKLAESRPSRSGSSFCVVLKVGCFNILSTPWTPERQATMTPELLNRAAKFMHKVVSTKTSCLREMVNAATQDQFRRQGLTAMIAEVGDSTRADADSVGQALKASVLGAVGVSV